jgi:hypothetical protein
MFENFYGRKEIVSSLCEDQQSKKKFEFLNDIEEWDSHDKQK